MWNFFLNSLRVILNQDGRVTANRRRRGAGSRQNVKKSGLEAGNSGNLKSWNNFRQKMRAKYAKFYSGEHTSG